VTLRALRLLRDVQLVAAEDTRHTRRLFRHYEITTPLISYHEHNKLVRTDTILGALAEGDVALVSDAGTPAINDPGHDLVVTAIEAGHVVTPVPGPSAPIVALIASGLPTTQWTFLGFLPHRPGARRAFLQRYAALQTTLLCFETPHRLRAALNDIYAVLGDRRICVARELTKIHEEFVRGLVHEVILHFEAHPPRGECVVVIEGAPAEQPRPAAASTTDWHELARTRLRNLHAQGVTGSAAAKQVARELGVPRNEVYAIWIALHEA
jgi:16S rRNA (cytidine1402-2'-O)-methyltransferase